MSRRKQNVKEASQETLCEVFIVVEAITYGTPEARHEAGAEVSDIPAESIPWLLEHGHIERKGGQ